MSLSTSTAPATKKEEEETTLEKMSAGKDRASSQGKEALRREGELERLLEEARSMIGKRTGPVDMSISRSATSTSREEITKGGADAAIEKARGASSVPKAQASVVEVATEIRSDKNTAAVLARIGVDAPKEQRQVVATAGSVQDMIRALSSERPPKGVSFMDWSASRLERDKLVSELNKTLAELRATDARYGELGADASVAGRIGPAATEVTRSRKNAA